MKRWRWLAGREQDGFGQGANCTFSGQGFGFGPAYDGAAGEGVSSHLNGEAAGCPIAAQQRMGAPTARTLLLTETGAIYEPSVSGLMVEVPCESQVTK